ncbi:MAG: MerR family transcriptional regulator [Candidatus Dormiibacterota bacterium]
MLTPRPNQTLSSGEFTRQSRLSAKALRIYDQIGLLRPGEVDPSNGYRRYRVDQLPTARLIAMLRGVDMSLAEIGWLLADLGQDHELAAQRLNSHLTELEARHTSRRTLVRHLHAILREVESPMFTVQTRHVPARRVMSIQRRLRAFETDAFAREAKRAFAEHLGGAAPTGPPSLIFHGIVDQDSDGPLEATLACPGQIEPSDLIGIRTEPAHDGALTTITSRSGRTRRSSPPTTRWPARLRWPPVSAVDCPVGRFI